jgi:trehalose 6-phosphate synthase
VHTEEVDIVLVSNRGPVSFVSTNGGFEMGRGAGGLAGALDWVARELGEHAVWIAAATSDDDRDAIAAGEVEDLPSLLGYPVHLIDIEKKMYDRYYNDVSNRMLWFANHCLWDELHIDRFGEAELEAWKEAYEPVNVRFAETVRKIASENALVLFQDYHLATAPGHLRRLGDEHTIFHFTHSSFCGPEGLERLPRPIPKTIIEGMLGADLLGFHVAAWVEGFLECCERIGARVDRDAGLVEYGGRRSWVRSYPIPIDPTDLRDRSAEEPATGWAGKLRELGGPLIVRADRAEPSKNIVRGFDAFELVLDRHPDLRGTARFVACLYPSRESMEEYQDYMKEVEAAVERINRRYPGSVTMYLEDDFDRTLGAYLVYDVLLVNSIMDGMNLVSKEGPAINQNEGVLVLSRTAGSHEELGDHALGIDDPYSVEATAGAIERAVRMGHDERARRAAALRRIVDERRPQDWIEAQVDDLVEVSQGRDPRTPPAQAR